MTIIKGRAIVIAGAAAPANSLSIGAVSNGPAAATITGTPPNQVLNLTLPPGANGTTPAFTIGTISTLSPGSSATVTITGTAPNYVLNFGVPAGTAGTNATTTATATTSTNGLMSATDKSKLDGLSPPAAPITTAVASGVRAMGTAFTLSASRNAWVTYSLGYTLTATLALGQNLQVVATVDGAEVGRISDAILLGLAGAINRNESMSFFVPAGKQVLFTKTGTAAITVTVVSGQETLL